MLKDVLALDTEARHSTRDLPSSSCAHLNARHNEENSTGSTPFDPSSTSKNKSGLPHDSPNFHPLNSKDDSASFILSNESLGPPKTLDLTSL